MPPLNPQDFASVLLKRYECLNVIADRPQDKVELVDTLEMPRSTLDDVVREIEQVGFVEYKDGKWHSTIAGRMAARIHEKYLDQLINLSAASPLIEVLSNDSEVSWDFIEGAEVHETHPDVLDGVMTILIDHVEVANDVRVVTPSVLAGYGDRFYRSGTARDDSSVEIIAPPAVHEWFHTMYPSAASKMFNDSQVNILNASIPFSFGLSIFDREHAGVSVFSECGIAGLLMNDTDNALSWAEEQYERVKKEANPIILRGGASRSSSHS